MPIPLENMYFKQGRLSTTLIPSTALMSLISSHCLQIQNSMQ